MYTKPGQAVPKSNRSCRCMRHGSLAQLVAGTSSIPGKAHCSRCLPAALQATSWVCSPLQMLHVSKGVQGLLDLSDVQLEDLMLLRQLYVTRRYLLSVKRLELMAGAQEKTPHPVDSVTRMSELATHLQQNASEDHNLLYNMSRAFYCGVSTTAQHTSGPNCSWSMTWLEYYSVFLSGTAWSLPCLTGSVCWQSAKSWYICCSQATKLCLTLHG